MVTWNCGSVSEHVGNIIGWDNIPSGISGTTLNMMTEQNLNYLNTYTNDNIECPSIVEKYQPILVALTQSDVLMTIETQDGGVTKVKLDMLNVEQEGHGLADFAKGLREDAIRKMKELGRHVRFRRVLS